MLREIKKEGRFFLPYKDITFILFFTEWIIYCISHDIQCLSNLYVPTTTTEQPIPPGVFPNALCFLLFLPFSFNCHNKTFFLKREDFSFSSPAMLQLMLINACSYLPPLPCPPGIFFLIPPERRHFWNFRESHKHVGILHSFLSMFHSFFPPILQKEGRSFLPPSLPVTLYGTAY